MLYLYLVMNSNVTKLLIEQYSSLNTEKKVFMRLKLKSFMKVSLAWERKLRKKIIQNIFSFNLISTVAVSNVLVQMNYLDDRRNSLCCNFKSQFQLMKKLTRSSIGIIRDTGKRCSELL